MGPEHVFIIIMTVAAAGHIARPPQSDLHRPAYVHDVPSEKIRECIAETKEAYFATEEDIGESLEELILECYDTETETDI